jgi:DNA repair protein SbcD/Mre11
VTSTRRILHAADIHLDSPLQKLGTYEHAPVERIRGASRRALENMVSLAIDRSVDLVLIAGDLYDGDWPDQNTGLFFVGQANRLVKAGIPLVVIRGNHDAANLMTSALPLPANPDGSPIMMRSDKVDLRCFESIGVAVHGRSFRTRAETENMAAE